MWGVCRHLINSLKIRFTLLAFQTAFEYLKIKSFQSVLDCFGSKTFSVCINLQFVSGAKMQVTPSSSSAWLKSNERSKDSLGLVGTIGQQGADEQLLATPGGKVKRSVPMDVNTVNLSAYMRREKETCSL